MGKYLTKFGMAVIREKIASLDRKREEALARAGQAAQNDSNAYHDNFEYEEGMRQQELFSQQLRSFCRLIEGAVIAPEPSGIDRVSLGHYVVVRRGDAGQEESYLLCGDGEGALFENACSVASPMGQALLGMARGETKVVSVAGRSVSVEVLDVRVAVDADVREAII